MDKLKDKLWNELEELDRKEKLSAADVELTKTLASAIEHLDAICGDGDGYSQAGDWEAMGRINGTYGGHGGNSYANRGRHYVRGHYSRSDGRHDGRGGYSRHGDFREMLEEAMDSAPNEQTRMKLERMIRDM